MSPSRGLRTWVGVLALTLAAAALYGFALGSAHSEICARNNALKFPLLVLVTDATCALSWSVIATALGVPLTFVGVQLAALRWFRDVSILLASLAPVVFVVARVARATDDGQLGEYDSFLALNVGFAGVAGALSMVRQAVGLLRELHIAHSRVVTLVALWFALTLAVGGQATFWMRPFFGFPATRGDTPPLILGSAPDVRGAHELLRSHVADHHTAAAPGALARCAASLTGFP
jgi:hypothetical protein